MRTEKVILVIAIVAIGMKFLQIPFGSMLITLSLSTVSILYFTLGFYFFSVKDLKDQNLWFSIGSGFFLSGGITGILFKLMYWPGSQIMLSIPLAFILLLFLLTFILSADSSIKKYYDRMKIRTGLIALVSLMLYFTPDKTLLAIQHRDDPELARLKEKAYGNRDNEEYQSALQEYLKKK